MKETSFIEQNKDKWKRFQTLAGSQNSDPEEIADLYTDITDDLSFAQTFYKRRTVRVYLNQIAQSIHNLVHKERGESLKKIIHVWKISLPLELYRSRKYLFFALIVFLFWGLVGAVTTMVNPDFPRMILGNEYVEMTLGNIKKGDPLGVYHDDYQLQMFFNITLNNIQVAFMTFIFGILFTIGTHVILFKNAIMLGAFQTFFYTKGLLITSFLGIWIHGAFEISSIVIAGGAGITLGNGLLFPGSYSRMQSLQLSAKRGLKIMMSLVPFLIMAGFLESFVTHNYQTLSEWSKWIIILFSFAIIVFYYIIYPLFVARKYPELIYETDPPTRQYNNYFKTAKLRDFGALLTDTFSFYRVHIGKIIQLNLFLTVPIIVLVVLLQDTLRFEDIRSQYDIDWVAQLRIMMGFDFQSGTDAFVALIWSVLLSYILLTVAYPFLHQAEPFELKKGLRFCLSKLPLVWLASTLLLACLFLIPWYWMFVFLFLSPFLSLIGIAVVYKSGGFWESVQKGFSYGAKSYGVLLMCTIVLCIIFFIFAQPIAFVFSFHEPYSGEPAIPDLLDLFADFVSNVARRYTPDFTVAGNIVRQIVYFFFLLFTLPFFAILMSFIYFDRVEKETATGLRMEFEQFGKRKRNQENSIDFE